MQTKRNQVVVTFNWITYLLNGLIDIFIQNWLAGFTAITPFFHFWLTLKSLFIATTWPLHSTNFQTHFLLKSCFNFHWSVLHFVIENCQFAIVKVSSIFALGKKIIHSIGIIRVRDYLKHAAHCVQKNQLYHQIQRWMLAAAFEM